MPFATVGISDVVGANAANRGPDVAWIQAYLNMTPPAQGGPAAKLKQDGRFGPLTQKAIEDFQRRQFGKSDGRVDPALRTELKFIELDGDASTRPSLHIEAARRQAQIWMNAGLRAVLRNINVAGNATLDPNGGQAFADLFELCFRLDLRGSDRAAAPTRQILFVRQKFERAATLLQQQIRTLNIKFLAAEDRLRAPFLPTQPPLSVGGTIILANYKFTDFDPTCAFGTGPFTRAAMLLQAAFIAADFSQTTVVANELFIRSGFSPADLAIRTSGHYSFFCQGMDAGGALPRPFHHAPEGVSGWQDRPGLP